MTPELKDFYLKKYQLPNSGGNFMSPVPKPQGGLQSSAISGNLMTPVTPHNFPSSTPIFTGEQSQAPAPVSQETKPDYNKYMNPQTGQYYTPEEYANNMASKIPVSKGADVPRYAGDAMMNPDESSEGLMGRARGLNNARNDIAVGATDPYSAATKSGIDYSPQELAAIEKAYAGVYDPAINDVFDRLKTREKEEQRKQDREDKIFSTNESIRAWRATTGSKSGTDDNFFTNANLKTGASRAGLEIDEFRQLDSDIKNYFVNPPKVYDSETGKSHFVRDNMDEMIEQIKNGELTAQEGAQEIIDGDLPEAVKLYLIGQLPLSVEEKDNWFMKIMKGIGKFFTD